MPFDVRLTAGAQRDLEELYAYVARHDSPANADQLLDHLQETALTLSQTPERGAIPGELAALGIHDYRQVFFKPYRIIYRTIGQTVFIYLIADGRRDMRSLLERRLVGG